MSLFDSVSGLNPRKSAFDLSYEKKFTCDMGQLIPIAIEECEPNSYWTLGNQAIIRFMPLVAPVLHQVDLKVWYFFVPYRLLWDEDEVNCWEAFITGGKDGRNAATLPRWTPTTFGEGSLWDFCGFPPDIDPELRRPMSFPRDAYNFIWNSFFRSEDLQDEVALTNEDILNVGWGRDYFTSSMLEQQRGVAPSLPISGNLPVTGIGKLASDDTYEGNPPEVVETGSATHVQYASGRLIGDATFDRQFYIKKDATGAYPDIRVNLSGATTFNVADLRLAFQIQKWMERNQRGGYRYIEYLNSHYGAFPRDDRLQRPEFLGGNKSRVIFSEVLQTSETNLTGTPQGNMAGHGITATKNYAGKYHVKEWGLIMGLMTVVPKPTYQNGINRQWERFTRYDFYTPEFQHLSEQAIENVEICAVDGNTTHNSGIFGYQARFNEMRVKDNMVCSQMRTTFNYWHFGRIFDPANPPELNEVFIECVPRKDPFAVQNIPELIVNFGNLIKAVRPMDPTSEPGLIDHF